MKTDTATQSDLDALSALNRDYIHSVQHGDVQRFDEILAEDFLCSNPDGSLVDKKQFLAQTAFSEMLRSSTHGPATPRPTGDDGMAVTPTSGRAGTGNGLRCQRM